MTTNPYAEAVEAAARALASLEPGEPWPSNEALGGSLTGTRDDEYRDGMREQAEDAVAAAVGPLLAPLRALHRHVPIPPGNGLQCAECRKPWPCYTTLTLDQIEGARDE